MRNGGGGWYRKQIVSVCKSEWAPRITSRCEREEMRGRKEDRVRGEETEKEREKET